MTWINWKRSVSDLLSRVTGLDTSVSTLNTQAGGLNTRMGTVESNLSGLDTDDVSEAGNKYYTAARARSDLLQATIDTSTTKAVTSKAIKDALAAKQNNLNLGYSLPTGDGSNGQVLATDGSGSLSWTTTAITVSRPWMMWVMWIPVAKVMVKS